MYFSRIFAYSYCLGPCNFQLGFIRSAHPQANDVTGLHSQLTQDVEDSLHAEQEIRHLQDQLQAQRDYVMQLISVNKAAEVHPCHCFLRILCWQPLHCMTLGFCALLLRCALFAARLHGISIFSFHSFVGPRHTDKAWLYAYKPHSIKKFAVMLHIQPCLIVMLHIQPCLRVAK